MTPSEIELLKRLSKPLITFDMLSSVISEIKPSKETLEIREINKDKDYDGYEGTMFFNYGDD